MLVRIIDLKEGCFFKLRSGSKLYKFISFTEETYKSSFSKGIIFMIDAYGKEWRIKRFSFTNVFQYPEMKQFPQSTPISTAVSKKPDNTVSIQK